MNCPYCGELIQMNANACRYCGSDKDTGWSQSRYMDEVDLPDCDDSDYKKIMEQEFGKEKPQPLSWQAITGFILLFLALILFIKTFV